MLHCNGGYFYVGHTDDLDLRIAQHQAGHFSGFTRDHHPVALVWSADFPTRYEAIATEKQLKGWSRAKKMALIRGDWDKISDLAKGKDRASTSSAYAGERRSMMLRSEIPLPTAQAELVEALPLSCHPQTPPAATFSVHAHAFRAEFGGLTIRFTIHGDIAPIIIPKQALDARRADNLWQTTCFEAFVRRPSSQGYIEVNAAPSHEWAAYHFTDYREGMADLALVRAPEIGCDASDTHFALEIDVTLPETWAAEAWSLALSAVIEETDGTKSYWALAHPLGAPDFHHPDCFTLQLEAPPRA